MDKKIKELSAYELDEAVSVEVMGWKIVEREGHSFYDTGTGNENNLMLPFLWRPSLVVGQAHDILSKMAESGFCPAIIYDDDGHWAVPTESVSSVAWSGTPADLSVAYFIEESMWCDTIARAICESALDAFRTWSLKE